MKEKKFAESDENKFKIRWEVKETEKKIQIFNKNKISKRKIC